MSRFASVVDDADGDGDAELAVGSMWLGDHGAVVLVPGGSVGEVDASTVALGVQGTSRDDLFGGWAIGADWNGDGAEDLVVGAPYSGADGVVSVASNAIPAAMRRLCDLARGGRRAEAEAFDAELQPIFDFMGVEPNPIPVKAILARQGFGHGLRLPLTSLSAEHAAAADAIAARIAEVERACAPPDRQALAG